MMEVKAIFVQPLIKVIRIVPFSNSWTNQLVGIVTGRVHPLKKVANWRLKDCNWSENGG